MVHDSLIAFDRAAFSGALFLPVPEPAKENVLTMQPPLRNPL
jgi:hypothetical protein